MLAVRAIGMINGSSAGDGHDLRRTIGMIGGEAQWT
jgi:hypothetical protein